MIVFRYDVRNFFTLLVIINGILVGVDTDHKIPGWETVFSPIFLGFFVVEVSMKMFAIGSIFFRDVWNVVDFLIVLVSISEQISSVASSNESKSGGTSVLRLFRVLRLVRILGRLEGLSVLIRSFLFSLQSVGWVGVLMILFIYMLGVMATTVMGQNEELMADVVASGSSDAVLWWSTVPRSMVTIMQVMTGDSWVAQIARPMGEQSILAYVFITFIFAVIGIGCLNLIAAIFVDSLLTISKEIKAEEAVKNGETVENALDTIAEVFSLVDRDGSGEVDEQEVSAAVEHLKGAQWSKVLQELDMTVEDVQNQLTSLDYVENSQGALVAGYADFEALFHDQYSPAPRTAVLKIQKTTQKAIVKCDSTEGKLVKLAANIKTLESKVDEILSTLDIESYEGALDDHDDEDDLLPVELAELVADK